MQIQNSRAIPPTYDSTHLSTSKAEATKTSLPVAKSETSGDSRETVVISALGRTLGAAISRAEAYHANASRGELRAIVDRTNNMLMGTGQRDTVKPDQETPKYGDDERVSISRKAT